MFKIGFFGGKMLPVHIGHIFCIRQAARQCEELYVLLFHSLPKEKSLIEQSILPKELLSPTTREKVLREELKDEKNIFIHAIDAANCVSEEAMVRGDNFDNAEFVIDIVGKAPDAVFSSEPSYSNFFYKSYPNAQHIVIDEQRTKFPVSGTIVRGLTLEKALPFLPQAYKEFLDNGDC